VVHSIYCGTVTQAFDVVVLDEKEHVIVPKCCKKLHPAHILIGSFNDMVFFTKNVLFRKKVAPGLAPGSVAKKAKIDVTVVSSDEEDFKGLVRTPVGPQDAIAMHIRKDAYEEAWYVYTQKGVYTKAVERELKKIFLLDSVGYTRWVLLKHDGLRQTRVAVHIGPKIIGYQPTQADKLHGASEATEAYPVIGVKRFEKLFKFVSSFSTVPVKLEEPQLSRALRAIKGSGSSSESD
jgi:hypothetical protein